MHSGSARWLGKLAFWKGLDLGRLPCSTWFAWRSQVASDKVKLWRVPSYAALHCTCSYWSLIWPLWGWRFPSNLATSSLPLRAAHRLREDLRLWTCEVRPGACAYLLPESLGGRKDGGTIEKWPRSFVESQCIGSLRLAEGKRDYQHETNSWKDSLVDCAELGCESLHSLLGLLITSAVPWNLPLQIVGQL